MHSADFLGSIFEYMMPIQSRFVNIKIQARSKTQPHSDFVVNARV